MGHPLKLAPIIYALADIRFLAIESIDASKETIGAIQDSLRKLGFPRFTASKTVHLLPDILPGSDFLNVRFRQSELNRYDFCDVQQKWLISLDKHHLSVSTSEYTQWEEFHPKFEQIVECVMSVLDGQNVHIERVGYRAIDKICPAPKELVEDIIDHRIVGGALHDIGVDGVKLAAARSSCSVRGIVERDNNAYAYIVSCDILNDGDSPLPLPIELMGPPQTIPTITPKQAVRSEGTFARLSIDIIYNASNSREAIFIYDKAKLSTLVHELKKIQSSFFKSLIAKNKLRDWT